MLFILPENLKKIVSSSGVNFLFRILGLGSSFVVTAIITKFYGIEAFGNYSLVFTILQATAIIFTLGIPNTLIKLIGQHDFQLSQARKLLLKGIKGALSFAIFPMLFFYFFSDFLGKKVFDNPTLIQNFLVVAIALPFFILHEIILYFFIATKNFMKYNLFMFVLPNLFFIGFLILFHQLVKSGYVCILAFSISMFFTFLLEIMSVFKLNPPKTYIPYRTKGLIKIASPLLFSGLFLYLLNWTNILLLGLLTDEKQVGIYNIASKVGSVGFLVIVSVSTIITPRMAELYGQKKMVELRTLTHNATRLIACLTIPVVVMLLFFADFILSFFGTEAVLGAKAMGIIALGVFFSAVSGNVDQILNMTDNQHILKNVTLICFVINIGLGLLLIPSFGVEGAAISSLLTNILINALCVYYIKKKLGFYTLF